MTVIKRTKGDSSSDLVTAIATLIPFLKDQKEYDAAEDLEKFAAQLKKAKTGSEEAKEAVAAIVDAFEGDHELISYTYQRENGGQWTEVEELSQASARVLSLARRMQ
jgi:hypothetical protein